MFPKRKLCVKLIIKGNIVREILFEVYDNINYII